MPVQKYILYYVQFINKICILKEGHLIHRLQENMVN